MAYRELGVIEIREVLRRFCLGGAQSTSSAGTRAGRTHAARTWSPRLSGVEVPGLKAPRCDFSALPAAPERAGRRVL
jgi:hypothetical protein